MKGIKTYWLIGCVLIGLGVGLRARRCPNEEWPRSHTQVAMVAIWPVGVIAAALSPDKEIACEGKGTDHG